MLLGPLLCSHVRTHGCRVAIDVRFSLQNPSAGLAMALQGLLEEKDTYRPLGGPMLLGTGLQ